MSKQKDAQFSDHQRGLFAGRTLPIRNVFLHVTKACNLHCSYCYFSARRPMPDEMSTADFDRLWPDMVALRPRKVVFTGGEPLARPDILKLLRGLRDADAGHHVIRCLNSNGHLVTSRLSEDLLGLADEVRVSLDALASCNDSLRGRGNFDAAMNALETYRAVGFDPKVLVTVTRQSLPDLEELLSFLISRGFIAININPFRAVGRGVAYPDLSVSELEIQLSMRRAMARFRGDELPSPEPDEMGTQCNCGVGRFLNIMPNGDVFPCHVLTPPEFCCGNVREESLVAICGGNGLLGTLAGLDFRQLVRIDTGLAELTSRKTCMGEVYSQSKQSPAWMKHIPQLKTSTF